MNPSKSARSISVVAIHLGIALAPRAHGGPPPQTAIDARVVGYVEQSFILQEGETYDRRPLDGLPPLPSEAAAVKPGLDRQMDLPLGGGIDGALPNPVFDVATGTSLSQAPAPTIAVGSNHVVVATAQGVAGYSKAGNLVMSSNLPSFFAALSVASATEPRVIWDEVDHRFVVIRST